MLLDLHECKAEVLNSPNALEKILLGSAQAAGFEVVSQITHAFYQQGVMVVLFLSQSYIALHTCPEEKSAALNAYACSEKKTIELGMDIVRSNLIEQLGAQSFTYHLIERTRDERALSLSNPDLNERQD